MNPMLELFEDVNNPLNAVEEIFLDNDWAYTREHNDKISVHVGAAKSSYIIDFLWQSQFSALQFICQYDIVIPDEQQSLLSTTLRSINSRLWLGHFDTATDKNIPCFRHTTLLRDISGETIDGYIRDLMDIAMAECEKHYFAFSMLASKQKLCKDTLELALSDQAGEA